jgi:hypothetical protein
MKVALCFIITSTEKKNETKTYLKINQKSHSLIFSFDIYNFGSITRLVI